MERTKRRVRKCLHLFTAFMTALFFAAQPCYSQSTVTPDGQTETAESNQKNEFKVPEPQAEEEAPAPQDECKAPEPQETSETSSSKTWLLVGGAAALVAGAVAIGSSGGGGDSSTTAADSETTASTDSSSTGTSGSSTSTTPNSSSSSTSTATTETVAEFTGPDVSGSGWHGTLIIENEGFEGTEGVTASIVQNGQNITLRTSSTLAYAKLFNGKISNNGYITVRDAQTQKIWTSYEGFATRSYIKLYDFVNGNTAFDRLILSR